MRQARKAIFCSALAAATLACGSALAADVPVAIVVDATGATSGLFGSVYAGFRAYAEKLNAAGGVSGQKIKYSLYDAQATLPGAQGAIRQALGEDPAAIVYTTRSANFAAVAPQIEKAGIPVLTNVAPDSFLYPPKEYIYMPTASAMNNGAAAVNFARQLAGGSLTGKKVAIIISETPYMREMLDAIDKMQAKLGFQLQKVEAVEMGSVSAASQAANVARTNPDFVIAGIAAGDPPVVIQALNVAGVNVPVIGVTSMSAGAIFQRFKLANFYAARDAVFPADSPMIVEAAKASATTDKTDNVFYTHGWIMAATVEKAMARCAPNCTSALVKTALRDLREVAVPGGASFGALTFSPTKRDGLARMQFYRWDAGKNAVAEAGAAVAAQ